MNRKNILICNEEVGISESLNLILKDDYDVSLCNNDKEYLRLLESGQKFDLLLLCIRQGGLEILKNIKAKSPELKVIE